MNQPSENPIEAVVFDYGGVLCHPPATSEIDGMAQTLGLPTDKFWRMYGRLRSPYDRGIIDAGEYWRNMAQCAGMLLGASDLAALHARDMNMWSGYNSSMIAFADELRQAGLKTGILSNMLAEMLTRLRQEAAWLSSFEVQVYSCELGLVKPEAAIYERLVERMGVQAAHTLFVDDLPANVEAARRAGLQAVVFESEQQLRAHLAGALPSLAVN